MTEEKSEPTYLISGELIRDIETYIQCGSDGTLPTESELLEAIGKCCARGPTERPFFPHRLVGETEIRTSIPDFSKAKVGDWYRGVGDISTVYEENFVRRFGQLLIGSIAEQAPVKPENVLLCFGNYGNCPADDQYCGVSAACHLKMTERRRHEAAIVTQAVAEAREKWERERLTCVEDITPEGATIVQAAKAQERERLLNELKEIVQKKYDSAYKNTCRYDKEALGDEAEEPYNKFYFNTYCGHATAFGKVLNDIESLRSNQKQERENE